MQATPSDSNEDDELSIILDNMVDGVVTIDETGIVQSFNAAAEKIFGYTESEVLGKNVTRLMGDLDRNAHAMYLERYLTTGRSKILGVGPREVVGIHKDGARIPLELAIGEATLKGERRFIGALRDISERKQIEIMLRQAQKLEAVGQLTGGIAHDFNNLLTVLMGSLELLDDMTEDKTARRLIAICSRAVHRGADLTKQLLAFSRRQILDPRPVVVSELVSNLVELLERTLGGHVEIRTIFEPDLSPILVDAGQLENALVNLALNARDAMPGGGRLRSKQRIPFSMRTTPNAITKSPPALMS